MTDQRYLLDTNIFSDIARHPHGRAAQRMLRVGVEQVGVSIIVACEIRFGLTKHVSERLKRRIESLLEDMTVLPLEPPVEQHYADIRSTLESSGTPIGPNDLLIAAHARALGHIVVTDNLREFCRVRGLTVENWLSEDV